jgi:outer membrane protein TolC
MRPLAAILSLTALVLAGCRTAVPDYERDARHQLDAATQAYRPAGHPPELPALSAGSTAADYLRFALLHHPEIEAAYDDWRASVAAITPARARPDPRLTFQADIADTVMSVMPGFMSDFTASGKRTALGREAAAGSAVAYREYVGTILQTAAAFRNAWLELAYVEQARQLHARAAAAVAEILAVSDARYATGRSLAGLEAQVRLQNIAAEHHAHHAALTDRLTAARIRFKSALGLPPSDPDPVWPDAPLTSTALPDDDELWSRVLAANPDLARMRALVELSVARVAAAEKSRTPDFSLGVMTDVKASPVMLRPVATLSLPVWRDKIAATIASAQARHDAAVARLDARQLTLAAGLAHALYRIREADRMIAYFDHTALPNLDRLAATAEASYQSGLSDAVSIPESHLHRITLHIDRLAMLLQRETAVTDLLLLTADVAPVDLPLLAESTASTRNR